MLLTLLLQTTSKPFVELRDIIAFLALIIGIVNLILSPRYLKSLERKKEAHSRRVNVFKALMATRGARLSYRHVEALNTVDLEFYDAKFAPVVNARDNYYDNLFDRDNSASHFVTAWADKNNELLAALLHEMAKSLGYQHTLVQIKRNVYTPQAHIDAENDDMAVRKGLAALLQNKEGFLPVYFQQDDEAMAAAAEKQAEVQDLTIEYMKQKLAGTIRDDV
jgi:hypothetical protein